MELTERFSYINSDFVDDDSIPAALPDDENESNVAPDAQEAQEYDPHHHSTSEEPTTYLNTMLNYLKASIGTGLFAMPSAFKESGYVVGVVGIFLVSLFYTVCVHLLVSSEYELCRRRRLPNLTYGATVNAAFTDGPSRLRWLAGIFEKITNFLMLAYQCGGCAVYIIFIGSNVKNLIDFYLVVTNVDLQVVMACTTLLIILLCWVRNLKILAPLTTVANITTTASIVLVFWYELREPSLEGERQAIQSVNRLPRFLSMTVFTVTCSGVVLPLKSGMRHPRLFTTATGVFNMSMVLVTLLCTIFGYVGFMKFGDRAEGSITLNLPVNELSGQSVVGLFSFSIYVSYFLCFYVVFEIIWNDYLDARIFNYRILCEYGVRTLFPIFTLFLACVVPNIEVFIALVGAFGIVSTSLVIPIFVHTIVFWNSFQTSSSFLFFAARNMILLALSITILVVCIVDSVSSVVDLWSS